MRLPDIFQITTHLLKTALHDSKGRGLSTELNHKNSTQPPKLKQIVLNFETEMFETPSPAFKEKKQLWCLVLSPVLTDQRQCDNSHFSPSDVYYRKTVKYLILKHWGLHKSGNYLLTCLKKQNKTQITEELCREKGKDMVNTQRMLPGCLGKN